MQDMAALLLISRELLKLLGNVKLLCILRFVLVELHLNETKSQAQFKISIKSSTAP
jgi:hypothetical protein